MIIGSLVDKMSSSSSSSSAIAKGDSLLSCFQVFMSPAAADAYVKVLFSGYIAQGEKVLQYESALRDYLENDNLVSVHSAT